MPKVKYEKTSEYLEIRDWDKTQTESSNMAWVKDYVNAEADPDYCKLTALQRYVLAGCCKLRARLHKNLPNDPEYIMRALCTLPLERRCGSCSIAVLMLYGFLIPSSQQLDFTDKNRGDKKRIEKTYRR